MAVRTVQREAAVFAAPVFRAADKLLACAVAILLGQWLANQSSKPFHHHTQHTHNNTHQEWCTAADMENQQVEVGVRHSQQLRASAY